MNTSCRTRFALFTILLMLVTGPALAVQAEETSMPDGILTDWLDHDDDGVADHSYVVAFTDTTNSAEFSVNVSHSDMDGNLMGEWVYLWDDENYTITAVNLTHHRITLPTNLSFGDEVTLTVNPEGSASWQPISRVIQATLWNQPLADHEITLTTDWNLKHQIENETTEEWDLNFSGRGWQQRADGVLIHDELGSGTLSIDETSSDGTNIMMTLDLDTIWLNETMEGSELTSQIFEMSGDGVMSMTSDDDGTMTINANIVDSYIMRSMQQGTVEERYRLEANGDINMTSSDDGEDMYLDGDLSLLLIEIHDLDGERLLDYTEFQATAEMEIQADGSYIYIDLSELYDLNHQVNGTLVNQHSKLLGDGTFFFSDTNDENGSIVIDGDVVTFHSEIVNNTKVGEEFHVDGDITGATTGSFGVWRRIDSQGETANSTGQLWQVNRIHQEDWFNLTGGGMFEGIGPSQSYNETWDQEVIYENYTNRTVYFRWYEQSDDPSQGEEYPENSPIPIPEYNDSNEESGLGEVNLSRETGLAPSEMMVGDRMGLYDSLLMHLELEAHSYSSYTRDGHTMGVTSWSGDYGSEEGIASGLVINEGILAGLIAEVSRQVAIEMNETDDIWFWENQSLERILSPSIVTAGENTAPDILSLTLLEGQVVNEGGNKVHIVAELSDPDWNLREVTVDLSSLGLGSITLNDIGQDGDVIVHDDKFTGSFVYMGLDSGNQSLSVTAEDHWTSTTEDFDISVVHRAPRITSFALGPESVGRGEQTSVTIKAFDSLEVTDVSIDLRGEGGELFQLTSIGDDYWEGNVTIPNTTSPGELLLPVRLEDSGGGYATTTRMYAPSSLAGTGGDAWDADSSSIPALMVINTGPILSEFTIMKNGEEVEEIIVPDVGDGISTYVFTVKVDDHDPVSSVQARLGMLAPVGEDTTWQSMRDDGQGVDDVAGDGVYSISVNVREGLPTSSVIIDLRGIDIYLAQTEPTMEVTITMSDGETNPLTDPGETFLGFATTGVIVLIVLGIIMLLAGVGIVVMLRRGGGLDEQLGLQP